MNKKKIVVLGGGYAGVHAAKALHKAFKKHQDKVEITLIDKKHHHILLTELHEVAGARVSEDSVKISFDRIFAGKKVTVVQDTIKETDFKKQQLVGEKATYEYDELIIGTGATTADFNIPGVKEHAFYLWSLEEAIKIRCHIEETVRKAAVESDAEKRKQMLTFVVAGGGFTGVEMMGELIEYLPILCKANKLDYEKEVELILCEGLGQILNMLPEKPVKKAWDYMEKKGVKIMVNNLITNVTEDGFITRQGADIKTKTLIWTCGIRGTEFGENLAVTDGKLGRKLVNDFMQTPDYENVYIVGDGMWYLENNRAVPQIVEAAEQTAITAAKSIIYKVKTELGLKAKEPVPFKSNFHGFMVSIGGRYAVSHTAGISLSGFFAMALKHMINVYYQSGVCGINGAWAYLKHEIFNMKNNRSLVGGLAANKVPAYWTTFLRMFLGVMWLIEGGGKIADGWLTDTTGSKVYWGAADGVGGASGAVAAATEAISAATSAATQAVASASQAVADAVSAASGEVAQYAPPLLKQPLALYTWINETFVAQAPYFFQIVIVLAEMAIGLMFLGGFLTFPAAIVSLGLSIMFLIGALAGTEILWYMAVSIVMLGGAGKAFGLDYWVMPWLKRMWNMTPLAKKTYLYLDEPTFSRKQMERKLNKKK